MLILGLTGGIGSGKTTISKVFKTLGIPCYNSDIEAKKLYYSDPQVKSSVIDLFGDGVYDERGQLDKSYLAQVVFSDESKLRQLNGIIHPAVKRHFESWLEQNQNHPFVIKEAAILIESGAYKSCDRILLITADEELRVQRVMSRDKSSREEVMARINKQMSDKEKEPFADYIITNENQEMVLPQVNNLFEKLKKN